MPSVTRVNTTHRILRQVPLVSMSLDCTAPNLLPISSRKRQALALIAPCVLVFDNSTSVCLAVFGSINNDQIALNGIDAKIMHTRTCSRSILAAQVACWREDEFRAPSRGKIPGLWGGMCNNFYTKNVILLLSRST
jgi:hypothetical protein